MQKKGLFRTFNILTQFLSFSWQIIHLKNVDVYTLKGEGGLRKCGCVHFERGGGPRKCVLYTQLNVDNYGQSLTHIGTL